MPIPTGNAPRNSPWGEGVSEGGRSQRSLTLQGVFVGKLGAQVSTQKMVAV